MATSTDPALGAIRLVWWRERLEALDQGALSPAEPRLRAIARDLLERGVSGRELARLEAAWAPLLEPFPWGEPQVNGLKRRGRILFGIGARLLGGDAEDAEGAGEIWSLVDGVHHCSDADVRKFLSGEVDGTGLPTKVPGAVRPLTVLAVLAMHDVRHQAGGARRVSAALAHRLLGKFPSRI